VTFVLLALALAAGAPRYDATWAAALPAGDTPLPAGVYAGPWTLPRGVHLLATPGAVLAGGDPVLTIGGDGVRVEGLTVRATGVGISARGVHALTLEADAVTGGTQAIYAGEAELRVIGSSLSGSDYGLLAFRTVLLLQEVRVFHVARTGFGIVRSTGTIEGCSFEGPFFEAAISVVGSNRLTLRHNRVRHAGAIGLKLVSSTGELFDNVVAGARSDPRGLEGDDVYAFASTLRSQRDSMTDATGTGLTVLGGTATVTGCTIADAGQAAVYVGETGHLELVGCTVDGAPAGLVVEPGATALARETKFLHVGGDGGV